MKEIKKERKKENLQTNKQTRCSCGIFERKQETGCRRAMLPSIIAGQLIIGFVSPCYRELKSLSVCTRTQESYRLAAGGHSGAGRCHTRDFIGFIFTEEWTEQRPGLVRKHRAARCTRADQRRRADYRVTLSRLTSCPCLTDAWLLSVNMTQEEKQSLPFSRKEKK